MMYPIRYTVKSVDAYFCCLNFKFLTTQLRGANPQQTIKNFGVNDMSDNTESGRVSIQLQRELDGANNMMCFLVDDIEISHYLMSLLTIRAIWRTGKKVFA